MNRLNNTKRRNSTRATIPKTIKMSTRTDHKEEKVPDRFSDIPGHSCFPTLINPAPKKTTAIDIPIVFNLDSTVSPPILSTAIIKYSTKNINKYIIAKNKINPASINLKLIKLFNLIISTFQEVYNGSGSGVNIGLGI